MTNDIHELAGAYALNALDPAEVAEFEAHYPTCITCSAEVASFQDVAAALAETTATAPPPHLFDSIGTEVNGASLSQSNLPQTPSASLTTKSSSFEWRRTALAAAAAIVLVFAGGVALINRDGSPSIDELASTSDAVVAVLDATGDDQAGKVEVLWSAERDEIGVIATGLPDPGAGHVYAVWFLLDEGVAPAALFRPENGAVEIVLPVDDTATTGWGITIEPEGGSAHPTTDVIFAGTI